MPSDPRVLQTLALFGAAIERFRSTVAATLEEIRGALAATRAGNEGRVEQLRRQFGPFAATRVDLERLASALETGRAVDASSRQRLEAAYETLQDVAERGQDFFCVQVPAGMSLDTAVSAQLAAIGRVFGAARVAAAARGAAAVSGMTDAQALARFPFTEWNTAERRVAPPLVVSIHGADLEVGSLARFLDGSLKIVLIVDGPCAPAPLVRLITPGVFVSQTHDLEEIAPLVSWPGAAVCALMPPTGGRFVHDPAAGRALWQRLTVRQARDGRLARLGGLSAAQQEEEILQLEALAARPSPAGSVTLPEDAGSDRADRLAAWLLRQVSLTGVEGS